MKKTVEGVGKTVDEAVQNALADLNVSADAVSIEVLDEGEKGGLLGLGRRDAKVLVSLTATEESADLPVVEAVADEGDASVVSDYFPESEGEQESASATEQVSYVVQQASLDHPDAEAVDDRAAEAVYYGDSEDTDSSRPMRPAAETAVEYVKKALSFFELNETIDVQVEDERLYLNIESDAAGVIIGRRGETLDALQYLTSVAVNRYSDEHIRVTVDAAGYRQRRRRRLEENALKIAEEVKRREAEYVMEPMNAADRRIVHYALQAVPGVRTESEGSEPNRAVVIIPTEDE